MNGAAWWWTKVIALGSLAAWALTGAGTGVLALTGQSAPRAFANACLLVAGLFAAGVVFRFGGAALRSSRALKSTSCAGGREETTVAEGRRGPRGRRYGIAPPPRSDRASLAFAVLATLVMIQVLVLGFVVGTKA
ncbi:MAG: hypothetical protein ABR579_07815 [Actinomycetota bacterium]